MTRHAPPTAQGAKTACPNTGPGAGRPVALWALLALAALSCSQGLQRSTGGVPCFTDDDCQSGEVCPEGVCVLPACDSGCNSGDGCCPTGCTFQTDTDCRETCGNGEVDEGETCDGDCPTTCADTDPRTEDTQIGSAENCDLVCLHTPIETCGNGDLDEGETCDGDCPTTCADTDPCTEDTQSGSAENCDLLCVHTPIQACVSGDGCCKEPCAIATDSDCPLRLDGGLATGATSTFDGKVFLPLLPYVTAGVAWNSDEGLTGSYPIANTLFDALYQTETWIDTSPVTFTMPVANGSYTVHLHFVDWVASIAVGERLFHVDLQGERKITDLDISAEAGKSTALVKSYDVNVTNGAIALTITNRVFYAEIAGLEIVPPGTAHLPTEQ